MSFMRRKMKQIGAMLLTLALLAAMPISALAAGPDTTEDVSLTIIKYKDPGGTLTAGNGTEQTLTGYTAIPNVKFTIQPATYSGTGDTDDVSSYTLGTAIEGVTNSAGKIVFSTDSSELVGTSTVLPGQGIYAVTETSGPDGQATTFLVSLPMLDPTDSTGGTWLYDVFAYPKNYMELDIAKAYTVPDDAAGTDDNILEWTIDVTLPAGMTTDTTNTEQSFVITDQIQNTALTYLINETNCLVGTVVNRAGTKTALAETTDYTVSLAGTTPDSLVITFTAEGIKKLAEAYDETVTGTTAPKVSFAYKTRVSLTDKNDLGTVTNKVSVDYTSSNGFVYDQKTATASGELYGIKITKTDVASAKLGGAKFRIYTNKADALADIADTTGATTTGALADTDGKVLEVITDSTTGEAYIYGLEPGVYYLVETVAPAGFNKLKEPITVTVDGTTVMTGTSLVDVSVINSSDFELPKTGGTGTLLFTAAGLILIGVAGVFLIAARKKSRKNMEV